MGDRPDKEKINYIAMCLREYWAPKDHLKYLTSEHPQLGGLSVLEAIAAGEIDEVVQTFRRLEADAYL